MERKIIQTRDGSHTISIPEMNVTYHSIHGAIRESRHVFIEAGLHYLINQSTNQPISLFEMGFGTGLNAFLTAIESEKLRKQIHYTTIDQFPLSIAETNSLNYTAILSDKDLFQKIQDSNWEEDVMLSDFFTLRKEENNLINYSTNQPFNLIYYDAFAPSAQPELWTKEVFEKMHHLLKPNGIVVTYCSKGDVRRAMIAAGFEVKKLTGPPGKREMLRAVKKI